MVLDLHEKENQKIWCFVKLRNINTDRPYNVEEEEHYLKKKGKKEYKVSIKAIQEGISLILNAIMIVKIHTNVLAKSKAKS